MSRAPGKFLGSCGGIFQLTHLMQGESGGASGPGGAGAGGLARAAVAESSSARSRIMGLGQPPHGLSSAVKLCKPAAPRALPQQARACVRGTTAGEGDGVPVVVAAARSVAPQRGRSGTQCSSSQPRPARGRQTARPASASPTSARRQREAAARANEAGGRKARPLRRVPVWPARAGFARVEWQRAGAVQTRLSSGPCATAAGSRRNRRQA